MTTYKTDLGQIGYLNMSGNPIPFDVNPGPTVTCKACGLCRYGVHMRGEVCASCAAPVAPDQHALERDGMVATFRVLGADLVRVTHCLNGRVSGTETMTRAAARAEYKNLRDGGFTPYQLRRR